jgi:hypothetical protein
MLRGKSEIRCYAHVLNKPMPTDAIQSIRQQAAAAGQCSTACAVCHTRTTHGQKQGVAKPFVQSTLPSKVLASTACCCCCLPANPAKSHYLLAPQTLPCQRKPSTNPILHWGFGPLHPHNQSVLARLLKRRKLTNQATAPRRSGSCSSAVTYKVNARKQAPDSAKEQAAAHQQCNHQEQHNESHIAHSPCDH